MSHNTPEAGGRTALQEQILTYLEQHPRAADTLEGIAQWWRGRSRSQVDLEALNAALIALADENRVQVIQSGAAPLYRLAEVQEVRYGSSDFSGLAASLRTEPHTLVLLTGNQNETRLAAIAIANGSQRSLERVDLTAVVSKYISETVKNLDRVFNDASQSGAVLLLENGDVLFGRRAGAASGGEGDAGRVLNLVREHIGRFTGTVAMSVEDADSARSIARRVRRARSVVVV